MKLVILLIQFIHPPSTKVQLFKNSKFSYIPYFSQCKKTTSNNLMMLSIHGKRLALFLLCTLATDKISATPSTSGRLHSKSSPEVRNGKMETDRTNPVLLSNLQNFTFYAMNMAFACSHASTLPAKPCSICMIEGIERRHLGPTLQDLRVRMPGVAQLLTTQFESKSLVWRNSVEKRGKHLGPTLDEIAQMKREQQKNGPALHKQQNPDDDDGNGPTKVHSTRT